MNNVFFTSDTHFGHERIIDLSNRPFDSVEAMNEALILNWNSRVSPSDIVFHLGDVALGNWEKWDSYLSRLNGKKFLSIGNHDRLFQSYSKKHQERFEPIYAQWFDYMCPEYRAFGVSLDEEKFNLSHFPYEGDSHGQDRYKKARPYDDGTPLIHGHTHSSDIVTRSEKGTIQIHVGVDAHNCAPVSLEEIRFFYREALG